jgi:tetratricopeptide (TPR) repeat protein
MLETIREYAGERLEAAGEAENLRRRHAEYFMALAEEAGPHEFDPVWIARLDAEQDNFRAALDRLEAADESDLALRLAGALTPFWDGGHVAEGRRRLERLLARGERPSVDRARALAGAAVLARQSGDAATARHRAGEALVLYRELGDARGTASATVTLGLAFADEGDFFRARELFQAGVRLLRDAGDEDNALFASRLLA